jgi:hypothetical protein
MAHRVFENFELPENNWTWTEDRFVYELSVKMPVQDRIIFERKLIAWPSWVSKKRQAEIEASKTDKLDIPVYADCIIELQLKQDLKWRWNEARGVGRGDTTVNYYFDLRVWDDTKKEWVKPSPRGRYIRAQFSAKYRGGTVLVKDPINFNVLLEYAQDEELPITIDPDIQNPKV